jgi:5-hydroxyisourate hydrolase
LSFAAQNATLRKNMEAPGCANCFPCRRICPILGWKHIRGEEKVSETGTDGRLTTHVLDTARGKPAAGMAIELFAVTGAGFELLTSTKTNADGRCDAPLLSNGALKRGEYELRFHAGDYLDRQGKASGRRFLDIIPIRFGIEDEGAHYHVPLLLAPYGYSTYRGS